MNKNKSLESLIRNIAFFVEWTPTIAPLQDYFSMPPT